MEGNKVVIMSALLVSLVVVLGQIQVEAKVSYTMEDAVVFKPCCPSATARGVYNVCLLPTPLACAQLARCILVPGGLRCPPRYPYNMLENSVNEYCKSGCVSSVCGAITTLQISDASEVVNGAVEKCSNACSAFCTKGSITTAVETA